MVVAQLAERSLPTTEIRASNPNIGNWKLNRKDENKEIEAGKGPSLKKLEAKNAQYKQIRVTGNITTYKGCFFHETCRIVLNQMLTPAQARPQSTEKGTASKTSQRYPFIPKKSIDTEI